MSGLSKIINELNDAYSEVSVEKMQVLCRIAGVRYRESEQANELAQELQAQGYILRVIKHAVADDSVGQSLILRDLENNFIRGYRVWIDFKDNYEVKVADLFSDADLSVFEGKK